MLDMHKKTDIPKMMTYTRTRDMLNLKTFFPALSPIEDLFIINSIQDLETNFTSIQNLFYKRCDTAIDHTLFDIEIIGDESPYTFLEKIKKIDSSGVMLLFRLNTPNLKRYLYDGGMSVAVDVGKRIHIEIVGKGFDGRELSKGITTHERYCILWEDLRKISIDTLKNYQTYLIPSEKYAQDRENRIDFLVDKGETKEIISSYIPTSYQSMPSFMWKMFFLLFLKKLEEMEEELMSAHMENFAVSGNVINSIFEPWQMFDKERYNSTTQNKKKKLILKKGHRNL